ncbi:hypothetical protein [Trichormus sp. NMC-1]|nr:hypothetical protein [Trichormus sp. NMC-1]
MNQVTGAYSRIQELGEREDTGKEENSPRVKSLATALITAIDAGLYTT